MSADCPRRFSTIRGRFGSIVLGSSHAHGMHVHEQVSMTFCVEGRAARVRGDDSIVEVPARHVAAFNSHEPHATLVDVVPETQVISLLLEPEWVETTFPIEGEPAAHFADQPAAIGPDLQARIDTLVAIMLSDDDEALLATVNDVVTDVVAQTFVLLGRPRFDGASISPAIIDYRIRKALRYIDETIAERMQLGEIARHVGLSRSHFFEQFRRSVGVSPSAYANWHRMLMAAEQLACGSPTLAELSDLLGFSGPTQFSRFFVQQVGISPSQFRQNVRTLDRPAPSRRKKPDFARAN